MSLLTNEVNVEVVLSDGLEPVTISFPAARLVVDPAATKAVVRLTIEENLNTVAVKPIAAHWKHAAGSATGVLAEGKFPGGNIEPGAPEIVVEFAFVGTPGEVTVKGTLAVEFGKAA